MQYERKGQPRYLAAVVALSDDRVQRPVRRSPFRDRAIEQKECAKSRRDGHGANQQIGRANRGEIRPGTNFRSKEGARLLSTTPTSPVELSSAWLTQALQRCSSLQSA